MYMKIMYSFFSSREELRANARKLARVREKKFYKKVASKAF